MSGPFSNPEVVSHTSDLTKNKIKQLLSGLVGANVSHLCDGVLVGASLNENAAHFPLPFARSRVQGRHSALQRITEIALSLLEDSFHYARRLKPTDLLHCCASPGGRMGSILFHRGPEEGGSPFVVQKIGNCVASTRECPVTLRDTHIE